MSSRLERLAELAAASGASELAREAQRLAERLGEGRLFVAAIGQFKRGKSSLLNALAGTALLPVGVVPVTSVVTLLRHGECLRAKLLRSGADWTPIPIAAVPRYVTEEGNPGNREQAEAVELSVPSEQLKCGLCLVDTPGLGSAFRADAQAARSFLPQLDAVLLVIGGDPPISGDELELAVEAARLTCELIVVLNKADRLTPEELDQARDHARRMLGERLGREAPLIHLVSAAERLRGERSRDWAALEATLERLTLGKRELLRSAEARGLARLGEAVGCELRERRDALARPVEESERRIQALRLGLAAAERSLWELRPLLEAEQLRLRRRLEERRERFLEGALPGAMGELAVGLRALPERGRARRARGGALAREIFRRRIERWRKEEVPEAERLHAEASRRFVDLGNELLQRLGAEGGAPLARLTPDDGLRAPPRLFYEDLWPLLSPLPLAWLWGAILPSGANERMLERELNGYLRELLAVYSTRVVEDVVARVLESRRWLEGWFRESVAGG
ncbi:MAG: dynamin family protein, partial [Deltaproteobacteria bacterium]